MEKDSLPNSSRNGTNWNSLLTDNPQQNIYPQSVLENISTPSLPNTTQDEKGPVMGSLFQLHQQQQHQLLQQQQIQQEKQTRILEQQQISLLQQQQQEQQREELQQQQITQEVSNSKQSEEKDAEQRYQTTVSALEATGLLDITLKTSELVQRNEAFQKDLEMFEKVVRATYRDFTGGKDF